MTRVRRAARWALWAAGAIATAGLLLLSRPADAQPGGEAPSEWEGLLDRLGSRAGPLVREGAPAAVLRLAPRAIDMGRSACASTAESAGITPVGVADLPESVQDVLRRSFPASVLGTVRIYFGVPLNDPANGIGILNSMASLFGTGQVLGMAFEDDVYVVYPLEALGRDPAALSTLAHELVHAAQFDALGYEGYRELYAREMAETLSYDQISLEREAYAFESLFPEWSPAGFFAFLEGPAENLRLAAIEVGEDGRPGLAMRALTGGESESLVSVGVTAAGEGLSRRAPLYLARSADATTPDQILDPHGGAPLHVFQHGRGGRVAYAGRVHADGPEVVAVAYPDGLEVAWRDAQGTVSQWVSGGVELQGAADTGMRLLRKTGGSEELWGWTGQRFAPRPAE